MVWNSFSDFLAMGGYGLYVWGSVGATVFLMTIEPLLVARSNRTLGAQIRRQIAAEGRDQGARNSRRSRA